jgi:hypothetical protein
MPPRELPQAEPTLLGYFPKHVVTRPDWLKAGQVCRVSECLSPGPEGFVQQLLHQAVVHCVPPSVAPTLPLPVDGR